MEKIVDILNHIKERISNPLIFSFICSWIIINWQITVGLIWYDALQIEKAGSTTIFDFISSKINIKNALWHPLIFAIAYTLLMPTIKNLIRALYAWCAKWGDNWNLKIMKGVKIPFEKYLKFREDYDTRSRILEDVISKESKSLMEYSTTKTELLQAQTTINELTQNLTENNNYIKQMNNLRILDGYWTNTYSEPSTLGKSRGIEEVYIENGRYNIIGKFGRKTHKFNITNFHFDIENRTIFFIKELVKEEKQFGKIGESIYNINNLRIEREDLLVGIENENTNIEYRKKDVGTIPLSTDKLINKK